MFPCSYFSYVTLNIYKDPASKASNQSVSHALIDKFSFLVDLLFKFDRISPFVDKY